MSELNKPDELMGYYLNKRMYTEANNLITASSTDKENIIERNQYLEWLMPYMSDTASNKQYDNFTISEINNLSEQMSAVSYHARNWREFHKKFQTPEYFPTDDSVSTLRKDMLIKMLPYSIADIYPNPTGGMLWLRYKDSSLELIPRISDITGKVLHINFEPLSTGFYGVDVSSLTDGIYLVELLNANGKLVSSHRVSIIH